MDTVDKYLGEATKNPQGMTISMADARALYQHFFKKDMPGDMPYAKAAQMVMDKFGKVKILQAMKKLKIQRM